MSSHAGKFEGEAERTTEAMRQRILDTMTPCEPYSSGDLADELGENRRNIHKHLEKLHDRGAVERKRLSSGSVTWWIDG